MLPPLRLLLLPVLCNSAPEISANEIPPAPYTAESTEPAAPLPAPHGAPPPTVPPSIGTHCQPDFFVVRTACCPQKPGHGCCCHRLEVDRFRCGSFHRSSLTEIIESLVPGTPVCFAVHGSFIQRTAIPELTQRRYQALTSRAIGRPVHVIGIHWPSGLNCPVCPTVQTFHLGRRAEWNGVYLAQLINMIPDSHPVGLLGHSHGTRVISSALHLLAGGCVGGCRVPDHYPNRRMRAVYGASAIDSHWLNPREKYGRALNRVECLLLMRTRRDIALTVYPLQDPLMHCALGKTGFSKRNLKKIGCYNSRKIRQVDVTKYVGCRHDVMAYMPHDAIARTMVPYLLFD